MVVVLREIQKEKKVKKVGKWKVEKVEKWKKKNGEKWGKMGEKMGK